MSRLLEVEKLSVEFSTPNGTVRAVREVSFAMDRERIGIVGESGSGKTLTARSLLGLIRPPGKVRARKMLFDGIDLNTADAGKWRQIRGARISMVMQDPKYSLNPVMTVGKQIAEVFRIHKKASRAEARDRAMEMLEAVRIRDPKRVFHAYPHEVSGGMGQRVMIAMMLAPDPDLLIADEPTSALDATVRLRLLSLLDDLVSRRGMGLIFISHDLNLVSSFCDRVLIMYAGRVVETCDARNLKRASHPYTRGLLECLPRIDGGGGFLPTLRRDPSWLGKTDD